MKPISLFFLHSFFIISLSVQSQSLNIDSLKKHIATEPDVDKKIEALSTLSNQFQNPNDKLVFAREAFRLSADANDKSKIIAASEMGISFGMLGKFDSSMLFFSKSLEYSLKAGDSIHISRAYNGLGNLSRMKSNLNDALSYFLKALDFAQSIPKKRGKADILTNISGVYYDLQDFEAALERVNEARTIYLELGDSLNISYTANLLSIVHNAFGNFELAYKYNREALEMLLKSKDTIQIIYNYLGTTEILLRQMKLDEASREALKVIDLANEFGEIDPLISSYATLSYIYFRQGKIDLAERYTNKTITVSKEYNVKNKLPEVYQIKALIASSKNDFERSITLINKGKSINDSIRSLEIADQVSELNVRYETEKKESEIARLNTEQEVRNLQLSQAKTRNVFLLVVLLLGFIVIIVIWRSYSQRTKINRQLKAANDTKDRLFSIIAHDIKNPLSAFTAITNSLEENYRSMSSDEVGLFISKLDSSANKLFDLLQNLLEWSITQSGSLSFNTEKVNLHLVIEETITLFQGAIEAKDLQTKNEVSKDMYVIADYKMLFSVVRNLVSNAVKFTPVNGEIFINSKPKGQLIEVEVSDTGSGLSDQLKETLFDKKSTNESKTGTGLGLVLCKEFVEKNGGTIRVESKKGVGSQFIFTLKSATNNE
jgi:signal transduction histidine kinase